MGLGNETKFSKTPTLLCNDSDILSVCCGSGFYFSQIFLFFIFYLFFIYFFIFLKKKRFFFDLQTNRKTFIFWKQQQQICR